jgi:putative ABC transport system permease protein
VTRLRVFLARVGGLFGRRSREAELHEEIQIHLDRLADEHLRRGMSHGDARLAARRAFGGVDQIKETYRDQRGLRFVDSLIQDARYALRTLRSHPGFTATAVLMLAISIGVNVAVFTVSSAALFKGFRLVDRNDRILYFHSEKNGRYAGVSYPDFQDWRTQAKSFEGMGTVGDLRIVLNDRSGVPERSNATRITSNAFRLLGQQPILGRDFAASDDVLGAAPVAILNYGFWTRRFGKDPAIIGQTLQIQGAPPTTVIGIMAEGFSFPQNQDLWVPLVPTSDFYTLNTLERRDARNLWFAFGLLADGVTAESARAELNTIGSRLANAYPRTNQGQVPRVQSFTEFFLGPNATLIYLAIWGAVGGVLLIACANLANLLLTRAMSRSREVSLRMALGAGRWRVVRQLLIESLVLSTLGGMCGWGMARWGVRAYEVFDNARVQDWKRDLLDYSMDYRILAYLTAISIGAGVLFGLVPALRLSRLDLHTVLKDGGHGATSGGHRERISGLLVIVEVVLAVVLLMGAGVMSRSFLNMSAAYGTARTANTLTMLVHLPEAKYPPYREAYVSFFDRLKPRLEAIPGVESAGIGPAPTGGVPRGLPYELAGSGSVDAHNRRTVTPVTVGPDYFRTLGATVRAGREFNQFDTASGVPVVLVNQRFASQHWPGGQALGQRLRLFDGETPEAWLTVVGVVSNIEYDAARQDMAPVVYVPYGQRAGGWDAWVLVRTSISASGIVPALRREIHAVDPEIVVWLGPETLSDQLAQGLYGNIRNHTMLFLTFAAIALVLASIGLYAVIAHAVSQRTQEIGVRMALGATRRDILALVLRGMLPVGLGLIIGLAASFPVNRVLSSELVQVSPADPIALVVVSVTLMVSAVVACVIPAHRAMRVDPVVALRHE